MLKRLYKKLISLVGSKSQSNPLPNPKTWREAFEQAHGQQARESDALLRKEAKRLTGSKNYNTFTFGKARAREAGIHWYIWETCQDSRVRPSHKNLQGVIVNYNEAPNAELLIGTGPGTKRHAGTAKGCRCYAAPLIMASDVHWPARVHYQGKIRVMTLSEFKKICKDNIFY